MNIIYRIKCFLLNNNFFYEKKDIENVEIIYLDVLNYCSGYLDNIIIIFRNLKMWFFRIYV